MKLVEYRTSTYDSFGNRWQVRGDMTWVSHKDRPFCKHVPLHDVIVSMSKHGLYRNLMIIADIAATPVEEYL